MITSEGKLRDVVRIDGGELYEGVREGFINCLTYCDYRLGGVLRIDRRSDRIVMRNPGTLRISPERIYNGDYTQARNSTIQKMLRMVGFGDNIGSGFRKIMNAWKIMGYSLPDIHEENEVNEVWLTLPISTDSKADTGNPTENVTNTTENVTKYEARRLEIIRHIDQNPYITTEMLAKQLDVSKRTILRDIEYLIVHGKLLREGGAFGGIWTLLTTHKQI